MASYLITGCSRGIGFELIRQLANSPDDITIFASARSANNPKFQKLLQEHPGRIIYIPLDVTNEGSIKNAVELVTAALNGRGLDVLVNNAGVMIPGRIEEMNDLEDTFRTNVSGVHALTRAALPIMRKGEQKKILNVSSTLGSISMQSVNHFVTVPSYKISKAALNMLTVVYAHELEKEGFTVFCLSPGWLKTDLGSEDADLPVETGVTAVLKILCQTGREDNGRFFNIHVPRLQSKIGFTAYDGKEVPW